MTGLPKLPGLTFVDPTISKFHLSHTLDKRNGYNVPRMYYNGIGGRILDINSVKHLGNRDPVRYDPTLTYGRTRDTALPLFLPHYALYDQKCLTFQAFFKQSVPESPLEYYRVRQVNIIYFLEDDTITVMEPKTLNSGIDQGRLVRRARIPKTERGDYWHWKDLAVGKDIAIYGVVYHTVNCDLFTKEYMASQGLIMSDPEQMPNDPYTLDRQMMIQTNLTKTPAADNKLRRFLEYDGKVLKFKAIWDDRDSEYGEMRKYELLYFLSDDTICIKECHERNEGRDPFPQLLRKTKLPKVWTDRPVTYPSIYLELSDAEVTEYYQPKDLLVGETVFVLGRKMLLYDCDEFTRNYFKNALCITQGPPIDVDPPKKEPPPRVMPPHDGLGSLEDSLQNTLTFMPKPPKTDVVRQIQNANKYLRYEMKMDTVHPEDEIRRFLLLYSLSDSTCKISEPPIRNSGIIGGKYLRATLLVRPGSDPLNPDYYSPSDFYIGAIITVFNQRFQIIGADLYVYRYMQANPEKFPCEVIENIRNFMFNMGYLNTDIEDQLADNKEVEKKNIRDAIGKDLEYTEGEMEKCLKSIKIGGENYDPELEVQKRAKILEEYERSLIPTYQVPEHGIYPVNKECAYPVYVGDVNTGQVCEEPTDGGYTPKHIDTSEEMQKKYYANILQQQRERCSEEARAKNPVICDDPIDDTFDTCKGKKEERPKPIMVSPPDIPPGACKVKVVRFYDEKDRCNTNRYDLCNLKSERTNCDCTDYKKC